MVTLVVFLNNSPWSCPVFPRPLFFLHAGSMPTTWGSPFKIWFNLKYWDIFVNILYSLSRYLWKVLELLEGISKPSLWHQACYCTWLRLGNGDFFIQSKCQGSRSEIIKNSICHPLIVLTCFIYVIFVIEIAMLQLPFSSCCRLPLNYLSCPDKYDFYGQAISPTLPLRDAFKKKKLHMEGKVPFWGEGVRKKGQISLV